MAIGKFACKHCGIVVAHKLGCPALASNDKKEAIAETLLTVPKITTETIDKLMESVTYHCWIVPGTTTTLVAAELDGGFVLAVGKSACVNKANFNAEIGYNIARTNAERQARDKLWELKGWEIKQGLNPERPSVRG